jgi:hypothetical protein
MLISFRNTALLLLVSFVGLSSCKKSSSDNATPSVADGTANVGGTVYSLPLVRTYNFGTYLVHAYKADGKILTGVGLTLASKPTASGDIMLDSNNAVEFVSGDSTLGSFATDRLYLKAGEKISVTKLSDGRLKYTLSNLTETDSTGKVLGVGKSLSASFTETVAAAPSSSSTANVGGTNYSLPLTQGDTSGGQYYLSGIRQDGSTSTALTVLMPSKPTTAKDIALSIPGAYVTFTIVSGTTVKEQRFYAKSSEKISTSLVGGKLKITMANLTETDYYGAAKAGGKPLTATLLEQ